MVWEKHSNQRNEAKRAASKRTNRFLLLLRRAFIRNARIASKTRRRRATQPISSPKPTRAQGGGRAHIEGIIAMTAVRVMARITRIINITKITKIAKMTTITRITRVTRVTRGIDVPGKTGTTRIARITRIAIITRIARITRIGRITRITRITRVATITNVEDVARANYVS